MAGATPGPDDQLIDDIVARFVSEQVLFGQLVENLRGAIEASPVRPLCHSLKWRVKDPEHLREKLGRKLKEARDKGEEFSITRENLYERVNDLIGIRILHLHTEQFSAINSALLAVLDEHRYRVVEGPIARLWDDEQRKYFESIHVETVPSNTRMYTSVHYVVELTTKTKRTCEIQVRTLAEELWGETDHAINYPRESDKLACRLQLKVLARATSTCTRLVDSIFATHQESNLPLRDK